MLIFILLVWDKASMQPTMSEATREYPANYLSIYCSSLSSIGVDTFGTLIWYSYQNLIKSLLWHLNNRYVKGDFELDLVSAVALVRWWSWSGPLRSWWHIIIKIIIPVFITSVISFIAKMIIISLPWQGECWRHRWPSRVFNRRVRGVGITPGLSKYISFMNYGNFINISIYQQSSAATTT